MKRWQYNLLILPIALFVRAPILLTLHALIRLGEWAEEMEHRVEHIPGLMLSQFGYFSPHPDGNSRTCSARASQTSAFVRPVLLNDPRASNSQN